jgi:hypothetical protein
VAIAVQQGMLEVVGTAIWEVSQEFQ